MKKILAGIIIVSFFSSGFVSAADGVAMNKPIPVNNQGASLKNSIVTVPAGVSFKGVFLAPISSSYAYAGQEVNLALSRDFYYKNNFVAPVGSTVTGTVIAVDKAKHGALNGRLVFRFTHIITPSGADIPISAIVKTEDESGILYGDSKWGILSPYESAELDGEGSAISRTIVPPSVYAGRGDNYMPALGSGGGLVKSIWDKGSEVDIPVKSSIELILIQPITTDPLSYEN